MKKVFAVLAAVALIWGVTAQAKVDRKAAAMATQMAEKQADAAVGKTMVEGPAAAAAAAVATPATPSAAPMMMHKGKHPHHSHCYKQCHALEGQNKDNCMKKCHHKGVNKSRYLASKRATARK